MFLRPYATLRDLTITHHEWFWWENPLSPKIGCLKLVKFELAWNRIALNLLVNHYIIYFHIFPGKPSFHTHISVSAQMFVSESPMFAWQRQKEPKVLAGLAISGAFLDAGLKCVQAGDLEFGSSHMDGMELRAWTSMSCSYFGVRDMGAYGDFPKWGYPQIIHFNRIFHEINHPAIVVSPLVESPIWCI